MFHQQRLTITIAMTLLAAPVVAQGRADQAATNDSAAMAAAIPAAIPTTITPAAAPSIDTNRGRQTVLQELQTANVGPVRATTADAMFNARAADPFAAPLAPPPSRTSRNTAMMIVGGAALIVGSIVGGDSGTILMVGGAVVGLIGLWNYLK